MIKLSSLLPIPKPEDYKVHLASWGGESHPLDVFVRDRKEWDKWNSYRYDRDRFNKDYILALISFYPEHNIWLFGGIYKVLSRKPENYAHSYEIEPVPGYDKFYDKLVGRLKICFPRPKGRQDSLKLEMTVGKYS